MNIDSMAETNFHQPASLQCLSPPTYSMDGLHTTNTTLCAGPSSLFCSATPNIDSKYTSPTFSHSGSSARTSSVCTDDDIAERNQGFSSPFPSTSATTLEVYSAIFQAPPIYAPEPTIGYGADRLTFIERLIWDSVRQIASIYGGLLNEPKTPMGKSLETLVHEGLIHGLCNEIVILPIMAAIQTRQGDTSQHHADMIPFPLFVAEMLRRMRASYFLFCTAMRYMLDIEPEVRAARERAKCGWCLSGARGCEHSRYQDLGVASRFSRGRSAILRKQKLGPDDPIPASHFTRSDPLAPLADPRKAFLGALILANKFHRDRTIGNKSWAALIGLSLEEVHAAERAVGQALGWALSRPWVGKEEDDNGNWKLGSSHPSFAETLFATNDHEVAKYGIKELREKGTLPPPVKSLQATLSHPLVRTGSNTIVDRQGHLSSSKLIRRSRSQTPLADERRIAPLPHRQQSLNQTLSLTNPIKKASSAPIVLQPFASGYTEEPAQDDMVDAIVRSEWAVCSSASPSSSEWMDATPTIEQIRSKRKASEDFGPTPLIRRGEQGQRMPVVSPTMHVSHTSSPAPAEPRGFDHSFVPWDGVVHDDSMSPGLTMGTPTTSSPSVGLLTRMGTPADLSNMSDVDHERPLTSRSSFAAFHPPRHFKSSLGMPTLTRANTLPV